jgi:RHS repeat-associated protein
MRKFTGKERDTESGLDNFGARYFSGARRFTGPDKPFADQHPEDPQSWNLYSYVTNNPLRFIDRNGRAKIEVRYDTIGPGYTHSYVVVTDRNGAQTYFRVDQRPVAPHHPGYLFRLIAVALALSLRVQVRRAPRVRPARTHRTRRVLGADPADQVPIPVRSAQSSQSMAGRGGESGYYKEA